MPVPILMQMVEPLFGCLGFNSWPRSGGPSQVEEEPSKFRDIPPEISPEFRVGTLTYDDAHRDIVHLRITGAQDDMKLSKVEFSNRWGAPQTAPPGAGCNGCRPRVLLTVKLPRNDRNDGEGRLHRLLGLGDRGYFIAERRWWRREEASNRRLMVYTFG